MHDLPRIRHASRLASALAMVQFDLGSPHLMALFEEQGLAPGRGYFVLRAAPMGMTPAPLVASAFAYFPHTMVEKLIIGGREAVAPGDLMTAAIPKLAAAAADAYDGHHALAELADLYERAVEGTDLSGRPLATAWRLVDWPADEPAARVFGAATVIREYRGDAHIHALASVGLTPLEGFMLARARDGIDPVEDAAGRGWRSDDMEPALERLAEIGAAEAGEVTAGGRDLWELAEALTDRMTRIWDPLDEAEFERSIELAEALTR